MNNPNVVNLAKPLPENKILDVGTIKNQCTEIKNLDGMIEYKLQLKETSTFSGASSIIKRFSFGEPNQLLDRTWKTILLMGATGMGKTTWINAMINYVLGVEWDDDFRFKLVDEDVRGASQAHSQTQGIIAYDLHYQNGFRIPFSLTIVDTPGFGDTEGIGRDEQITSAIQEFFEHPSGIQELDTVGFAVKCSDARLTIQQKHVFNSVLSIFGKNVKENVRFLINFNEGKRPLVLDAIKEAKLPCRLDSKGLPCHQKFNNGAIFIQPTDDDDMSPIEWKNGMKNFQLFFDELKNMPIKSLQMTLEVLDTRKCLENQLDFMQRDIQRQLKKREELRNTEAIIAIHEQEVDKNKHFEKEVLVPTRKKVVVDKQSALNCTKCEMTCHYPCNLKLWSSLCPAFWRLEDFTPDIKSIVQQIITRTDLSPNQSIESIRADLFIGVTGLFMKAAKNFSTLTCKVCHDHCSIKEHINESSRWEFTQEEQTITMDDVRRKYEDAMEKKLNTEELKKALQTDIDNLNSEIFKATQLITEYSNVLKAKALLRGDPLTTVDYITMMIENEKKEKKLGYAERIKGLEDVLTKAKFHASQS